MSASNEQLAMRFVELLAQSAARNGQGASRWTTMNPAWRRVFVEAVPAFLDEISHESIPVGHMDERREDEQIRQLCQNLTARQRLKTYRLACTNDLVVSKEQSFRHPDTRLTVDELRKGTALAISIAFKVAASVLDRFLKAREEMMVDPVETIRQLAEARKMSQKFADEVASSYSAEPEPTRFGVINAFTRAAQKLGPLQRIEMERFAGRLLEAKL